MMRIPSPARTPVPEGIPSEPITVREGIDHQHQSERTSRLLEGHVGGVANLRLHREIR